jgi:hypothetical protein
MMGVHQTKNALRKMLGVHDLADRPEMGALLDGGYWKYGNTVPLLDLVQRVTGAPLSADAWVSEIEADVEEVVVREKADYVAAVKVGPKYKPADAVDAAEVEKKLDMRVELVHGALTIADSAADGGLGPANAKFAKFVRDTYFK